MTQPKRMKFCFCLFFLVFLTPSDRFEPPHVREIAPVQPVVNIIYGSWVIADLDIGIDGRVHLPRVLKGAEPFLSNVVSSVELWTFSPAQLNAPTESHVTAIFLFRARQVPPIPPPELSDIGIGPDQGPTPVSLSDPGYVPTSVAEGDVVLELRISDSGSIEQVRTVKGVPGLTEFTAQAVRSWKFAPALISGHSVPGTVTATISYLRPVLR